MVRELVMGSVVIAGMAIVVPKVLTGVVDPEEASAQAERGDGAAARNAAVRTSKAAPESVYQLEIHAAANGHFYLDAGINHATIPVMLDTGASVVALRESDAASAGIRPHRDDFNVPISTANGTSLGASAMIDRIVVDHIEIRQVQAVVIPDERLAISLLGTNFLSRLHRFEVSGRVLIIEN